MLDVHPPEHTPHSLRDFFIHIATFVVGLCIAVGIEQVVEHFHNRHVEHQAREHIREEIKVNLQITARDSEFTKTIMANMDRNIALLRMLQLGRQIRNSKLDFNWDNQFQYDAAFTNAKDTGALALMPYDEAAMYSDAYKGVALDYDLGKEFITQVADAQAAMRGHTEGSLTPPEVEEILTRCSEAKVKGLSFEMSIDLQAKEWNAALNGNFRNDFAGGK